MRHNLNRFLHSRRFMTLTTLLLVLALLLPLLTPSYSNAAIASKPMEGNLMKTSLLEVAPTATPSLVQSVPSDQGNGNAITSGLHLTLSEGGQQTQTTETLPVAPAQPL